MSDSLKNRVRLRDLDRAKGLGIFLVVLGHIVATQPPADNDWYVLLRSLIYHFHMPFFLFISGLVAGVTYSPVSDLRGYRGFVARKFDRLIPAYLLMAAIVFAGKWLAESLVHVDRPIGSFTEFFAVLYSPRTSYSRYLWYVYVLFLYYLPLPAVLAGKQPARLATLFGLAFALSCYGQYGTPSPYFGADIFCEYAVFFYGGAIAGTYWPGYVALVDRWGMWMCGLFFATLVGEGAAWWDVSRLWVGLLSCVALHRIVRQEFVLGGFVEFLGRYSFPIYLLNTIAIGSVKALVLSFTSWDGPHFLGVAPLLLVSGLLLPIALRETVLRRIPLVERWTA